MATIEVKVPNIGDFKGVEVIEVLVNEGQDVKKNDAHGCHRVVGMRQLTR